MAILSETVWMPLANEGLLQILPQQLIIPPQLRAGPLKCSYFSTLCQTPCAKGALYGLSSTLSSFVHKFLAISTASNPSFRSRCIIRQNSCSSKSLSNGWSLEDTCFNRHFSAAFTWGSRSCDLESIRTLRKSQWCRKSTTLRDGLIFPVCPAAYR